VGYNQRLSGMDAASQPAEKGSRRLCVQPTLPDPATGTDRQLTLLRASTLPHPATGTDRQLTLLQASTLPHPATGTDRQLTLLRASTLPHPATGTDRQLAMSTMLLTHCESGSHMNTVTRPASPSPARHSAGNVHRSYPAQRAHS